jgi:hypothetical protein
MQISSWVATTKIAGNKKKCAPRNIRAASARPPVDAINAISQIPPE